MKRIRSIVLGSWRKWGVAGSLLVVGWLLVAGENSKEQNPGEIANLPEAGKSAKNLIQIDLPSAKFLSIDFLSLDSAYAQTESDVAEADVTTTTLPPVKPEELRYGLWRDGKAVFSDIELLDLFIPAPYASGYKPDQPINFSHRIHVEKNGMECQYCHSGVAKGSFATIPAVELCMGCHAVVKTDSPEIKKLKEYWDDKRPIEWEPVNNLPEHAHFNHERHVKAGVGCHSCHGQVQKMDKVERVSTLKMGFCVSCHRERGVSIDCAVCHY